MTGSTNSRVRILRPFPPFGAKRAATVRERGVALILVMGAVLILGVVLAEMHETTATSYGLAMVQRDRLQAEYIAKSGISLTRLLVAAEPQIRELIAPTYQLLTQRRGRPPQLPVWTYANAVLAPFCNFESSRGNTDAGIDFSAAEGLGNTGGTCELLSFAENSKLNVNEALSLNADQSRLETARLVYAMVGGYNQPNAYDRMFEERDPDGQITSRLDMISALIDWWDPDTQRTTFDPGPPSTIDSVSGTEDDIYGSFRDPYLPRNAPFDSLEELRLVRGVGDDFWSTFVEPDPDDPTRRFVTVYGSGKVNPNEAFPEVLLARTCSILQGTTLCTEAESRKFVSLINMVRSMAPLPWFTNVNEYLNFLQGRGGPGELWPMLTNPMLNEMTEPLRFTPITITPEQVRVFNGILVFAARILTVQSTGWVGNCEGRTDDDGVSCGDGIDNDEDGDVDTDDAGCSEDAASADAILARCTRVRIRAVLNTDPAWTPPPPNAGQMPALGVIQHWRVE